MREKKLTALIVDQDADSGKAMQRLTSTLFTQVQLQTDLIQALKDCHERKPTVLLVNLNIKYRTAVFDLVTELGGKKPLVFGYNDAHEAELVAHALEVGFQDIFSRPFDEAVIATKIGKHVHHEKTQDHEISHTKLKIPLEAVFLQRGTVRTVDENGFLLTTLHPLNKGSTLKLKGELIQEIFQQEISDFLITRTSISEDGKENFVYLEPRHQSEETYAQLRRYLLKKNEK